MYTFNLLIYFNASLYPCTCDPIAIRFILITQLMHRPVTKHQGLRFEDSFDSKFCAIFENLFLNCRLLRRFAGGVT